ncbi:DUF4468 domain-containing protein [Marinifilum breve]|nr:DUF4468 domain-containing protein [Marinifilum breve]
MKKLLVAIMLLCSFTGFSKEYTEVVNVDGKTADQLYSSAREWFAETFKSANAVLQMDDPVAGKLIGNGISQVHITVRSMTVPVDMSFSIKVFVKDGKYKYDINSILIGGQYKSTLEEYEHACTYEGAKAALIKAGMRNPKDKLIQKTMAANKLNYPLFEQEIEKIAKSLKKAMLANEDDW